MTSKLASRLPIQQMIASVIQEATEKLAENEAAKSDKVKKLISYEKKEHGHIPSISEEKEECHEKKASYNYSLITDPVYIEKLASSLEGLASNLDRIEFPQRGALQKAAEKSESPTGPGKGPGALPVSTAVGGQQSYKKNHPKTEDAATSGANSPLSGARPGDSKTQLHNTMHEAPGGGNVAPTAKYPEKGPLVAGPSAMGKHASEKTATSGDYVLPYIVSQGLGGIVGHNYGKKQKERGEKYNFGGNQLLSTLLPGGVGYQIGRGIAHGRDNDSKKEKSAALRQAVLAKLAGEDVLKANISAGTDNPLAGMGQLTSTQSGESSPSQAGDPQGGMGNQARRFIQSNKSAIDFTKRDAKGPVKTQLSEVFDEPALNASTDTRLQENLRNSGKAGVKIAGHIGNLQKIASQGCSCQTIDEGCAFCALQEKVAAFKQKLASKKKLANAMMGYSGGPSMSPPSATAGAGMGGMTSMANAGADMDGCVCSGMGECRACKLKMLLAAMKSKEQAPSGPMSPTGQPPEEPPTQTMPAGNM